MPNPYIHVVCTDSLNKEMKRRQQNFDPLQIITTVYADVSTSEFSQTKCKSMNWIIYFLY